MRFLVLKCRCKVTCIRNVIAVWQVAGRDRFSIYGTVDPSAPVQKPANSEVESKQSLVLSTFGLKSSSGLLQDKGARRAGRCKKESIKILGDLQHLSRLVYAAKFLVDDTVDGQDTRRDSTYPSKIAPTMRRRQAVPDTASRSISMLFWDALSMPFRYYMADCGSRQWSTAGVPRGFPPCSSWRSNFSPFEKI